MIVDEWILKPVALLSEAENPLQFSCFISSENYFMAKKEQRAEVMRKILLDEQNNECGNLDKVSSVIKKSSKSKKSKTTTTESKIDELSARMDILFQSNATLIEENAITTTHIRKLDAKIEELIEEKTIMKTRIENLEAKVERCFNPLKKST